MFYIGFRVFGLDVLYWDQIFGTVFFFSISSSPSIHITIELLVKKMSCGKLTKGLCDMQVFFLCLWGKERHIYLTRAPLSRTYNSIFIVERQYRHQWMAAQTDEGIFIYKYGHFYSYKL